MRARNVSEKSRFGFERSSLLMTCWELRKFLESAAGSSYGLGVALFEPKGFWPVELLMQGTTGGGWSNIATSIIFVLGLGHRSLVGRCANE